jgi:hypothetical protein
MSDFHELVILGRGTQLGGSLELDHERGTCFLAVKAWDRGDNFGLEIRMTPREARELAAHLLRWAAGAEAAEVEP